MLLSPSYLPGLNVGWALAFLVAIIPILAINKRRSIMNFDFDTKGLEAYQTDENKETEGVWLDFAGGRSIKVLRAGGANKAFKRAFQAALKPYRRQIDNGTMDDSVSERIMLETYAKYVIVDWEGITDKHGDPIPYSREACIAFFTALPEMFGDVIQLAQSAATFGLDDEEEVAEMLGEDLPGSSSTESRPRR